MLIKTVTMLELLMYVNLNCYNRVVVYVNLNCYNVRVVLYVN